MFMILLDLFEVLIFFLEISLLYKIQIFSGNSAIRWFQVNFQCQNFQGMVKHWDRNHKLKYLVP